MRTDCDWPPAAGTGIWNFSTGLAGLVTSMITTPFSSTGLPGFSGLGLLPPCVARKRNRPSIRVHDDVRLVRRAA